jgi:hypothetical protein
MMRATGGLLMLVLLSGCAVSPRLSPGAHARTIPGNAGAAVSTADGIEIVAEAGWPGNQGILAQVAPFWVSIRNVSGAPVVLKYDGLTLAGQAAIPPEGIRGSFLQTAALLPDAYDALSGCVAGMSAGSYFAPLNPGVTYYHNGLPPGLFPDPSGYDPYRWVNVPLPTGSMLAWALPEGVLQSGGSVTGYLYFPRTDPESGEVVFTASLQRSDGAVTISIPFKIIKK